MSIETYQTTAAAEVLAKIGMPTWENGMMQFRLLVSDREFCVEQSRPKHLSVHAAADYLALCLLRDHLREWLAERNIVLDKSYGAGPHGHTAHKGDDSLCTNGQWGDVAGAELAEWEDYDEALLASVRAAMEKERP